MFLNYRSILNQAIQLVVLNAQKRGHARAEYVLDQAAKMNPARKKRDTDLVSVIFIYSFNRRIIMKRPVHFLGFLIRGRHAETKTGDFWKCVFRRTARPCYSGHCVVLTARFGESAVNRLRKSALRGRRQSGSSDELPVSLVAGRWRFVRVPKVAPQTTGFDEARPAQVAGVRLTANLRMHALVALRKSDIRHCGSVKRELSTGTRENEDDDDTRC